ncbi:MAG TPA: RluA family pseudouridine synthase [Candidatus Binatia bacterium]|nr:RluA family pseudouridine synthase [Candidatus Binatia bacterium]
MNADRSWIVPDDAQGIRLDAFVRRCLPHLSAREAERAIEAGAFWPAGRRGRKGDRLSGGDEVVFRGDPHWLATTPPPEPSLGIFVRYEDDSVILVDKPAGIATHGFSGREKRSLANFLAATHPNLRGVGRSPWEPGLINRLDRGTSGLVLAAKDQLSFEDLRAQSQAGGIKKTYWALVWGVTAESGTVAVPLAHDSKDRRKMRPAAKPDESRRTRVWPASTLFRRRLSAGGFSLLEIEIVRGVTHQIRAHLQSAGHPIVGDPLYGGRRRDPFGLGRQFLHARSIEFRHPADGRKVSVDSPLPGDLTRVMAELGMPA